MMDSSLVYDRPPPSWWQLGPALWLGATAVLIFAYLVFNIPGSWFGGSTPQQFPGASMKVFTGTAQAEDGKMVITGTDTRNAVILGLETPYISTQEYGLIALDIEGVPDNVEVESVAGRCSRDESKFGGSVLGRTPAGRPIHPRRSQSA